MRNALRTVALMVRISWRADAVRSLFAVVTAVGQMASLPLRAIGLRTLTDGFIRGDTGEALRGVAVVLALTATNRLMVHASLNVRLRLRENTQLYLDSHIMGMTAGIPGLEHHERPEYLNEVELIRNERGYLANPFNPISWTLASLAQGVSTVALLAGVDPRLALLPLFGGATAWATGRGENRLIALIDAQAEDNRILRHHYELATLPTSAKEVRVFGLTDELLSRRRRLFDRLEGQRRALSRERVAISSAAWTMFAAGYVAALAFTARAVTRGEATVGDAVLILTIGSQLDQQLAELGENVAWFVRTHRAVRRLRWFSDYAEASHAALEPTEPARLPDELRDGIRFEHVAFGYPATETTVLRDVDLHLPAGSTVAIVGENGAGKTTLIKLLCRFYEPTEGRILVDGVDLRAVHVDEWRQRITAGFQDFAMFQLLARETVSVGDVTNDTEAAVLRALERATTPEVVDQLPNGLATQLGRDFDTGVEISLGQWQKLALGRAMMRPDPLLAILDEPTASLDAPTEHRLFERFHGEARAAARARGAITILISHRFSTVRMADLILVVDDGRIIEAGDHASLIARRGLYAELYELQARAYR
ncbi:MAG TPA: ABC transporter ATP-binding protein [Acidimicrobiales bacterium]|nr:ABC transporter ATP-binding protein [Acidimicrobiales bacterium]